MVCMAGLQGEREELCSLPASCLFRITSQKVVVKNGLWME